MKSQYQLKPCRTATANQKPAPVVGQSEELLFWPMRMQKLAALANRIAAFFGPIRELELLNLSNRKLNLDSKKAANSNCPKVPNKPIQASAVCKLDYRLGLIQAWVKLKLRLDPSSSSARFKLRLVSSSGLFQAWLTSLARKVNTGTS